MAKWKYVKKQTFSYKETFLFLPDNEKMTLHIKRFEILKKVIEQVNRTVFQADVEKVNDVIIDKIWTVFNYDNVIELKKKLAGKKGPLVMEVIKKKNDETMEDYYEIVIVKQIPKAE